MNMQVEVLMNNPKVQRGTILVIRTDGREEVIQSRPKSRLDDIKRSIVAPDLDFVRIGKSDYSDLVMAVDDAGWETELVDHGDGRMELKPVRARKPINPKASDLYHSICVPGTVHMIVGDVAIFHDDER